MGILAMAAIPLLQVTTEANRNADSLEMRLLARTVAENEMARAIASGTVLDAGVATGQETQLGRSYVWTRTASRAQIGELQNLVVEVRPSQSSQVLARLEGLKYIPKNLTGATNVDAPDGEEEP